MEILNVRIESTSLGFEDHGILTFYLFLEWEGAGQGFGGYALGKAYTTFVIEGILKTIEVENWEDLSGKYIRIKRKDGKIIEIGNIIKDKWFNPAK